MILHTLEGDYAITRRFDNLPPNLEAVSLAQTVLNQLVFNEPLGRILQALLDLADANRPLPLFRKTILDKQISKKMRLARSATTIRALVSSRYKKRIKYLSRFDPEDGQ